MFASVFDTVCLVAVFLQLFLKSSCCVIDLVYYLLAIAELKEMFSLLECKYLGKELRSYCQSLMLSPMSDLS